LKVLHARLQGGVDALREEFAAADQARALPNPLATGGGQAPGEFP
jgi:hypothetical protein